MKRRKRAIARAARARLSLIAATSGDERELAKQELLKEMKTLDALLNDPRVYTNTVLVEAHSQHKKVQELAPSYIDLIERQPLVLADIKLAEDEATERSNVATTTLKAVSHGSAVTQRLAGKMDDLHQHSDSITEILQLIEIALQANILALNAAVEAARVGNHERGFAVVAAEVRTLAQRCTAVVREIGKVISTTVSDVEAGAILARDATKSMEKVRRAIERTAEFATAMKMPSHPQAARIGALGDSVRAMDESTMRNAALVQQDAAASILHQQAETLAADTGVFKLEPPITPSST